MLKILARLACLCQTLETTNQSTNQPTNQPSLVNSSCYFGTICSCYQFICPIYNEVSISEWTKKNKIGNGLWGMEKVIE